MLVRLVILFVLVSVQVYGQNWNGSTDTDWNTGANWDGSLVPTATGSVTIPSAGVANFPELSSAVTVTSLTIDGGATLRLMAFDMTVTGDLSITGALQMGSGNLDVNGNIATSGTWNWNVGGQTVTAVGNVTLTNTGTLMTATGATLVFDGTSSLTSAGLPFPDIEIGGTGSLALVDNLDLNGNLTVAVGLGSALDITNMTLTVAGDVNLTNLDTFIGLGSTLQFDGPADLTSAGQIWNDVTMLSGSTLTTTDALTITGVLTQNTAAGVFTAEDNVTLQNVAIHRLNGNVILDGMIFTSAGSLTLGNNTNFDRVTLSGGPVTITSGVGGSTLTLNAALDGNQNLTLDLSSITTINGRVGGITPIGATTGTSLTINSTNTTHFRDEVTLSPVGATVVSIIQADIAGRIIFDEDITLQGTSESIFNADVRLTSVSSPGPLTLTTAGDLTVGNNATTDALTLGDALGGFRVTLTDGVATRRLVVNGTIDGARNLNLDFSDTTQDSIIYGEVGSANPIGSRSGLRPALTINSASPTVFEESVRTSAATNVLVDPVLSLEQADTAGTLTFKGDVLLAGTDPVTLAGNVVLDGMTLTMAGELTIGNAPTDTLTISNGDVRILGSGDNTDITFTSRLVTIVPPAGNLDLTVDATAASASSSTTSGNIVVENTMGNAANRLGNITFTATSIILQNSIYSSSFQTYNTLDAGTRLNFSANGVIDANSTVVTFDDLYILAANAGRSITFPNLTLVTRRFTFYQGTVDISNTTLATNGDFVMLGANISIDDPERPGAAVNEWVYPELSTLLYDPGTYTANFGSTGLNGATITVLSGKDFYVNGTDLDATANWTLQLPDNTTANPIAVAPWGSPYAIVLESTVGFCTVTSQTIIAANTVTARSGIGVVGVTPAPPARPNTTFAYQPAIAQPTAANGYAPTVRSAIVSSYGYDFTRSTITSVETVKSDLVKLTFNRPIYNTNNIITAQVGSIQAGKSGVGGGLVAFATSYVDGDRGAINQTQSTDGNFALQTIYLKLPNTASWRTDATGSDLVTAVNGGLGASGSSDADGNSGAGTLGNIVPDITFDKGILFGSNGADFVIADVVNSDTNFTTTTDATGPVLHTIEVGREDNTPSEVAYHNYFRLIYSEPLAFGDINGSTTPNDAVLGLRYTASPTTFVRAQTTSGSNGNHGGEILDNGAGVIQVAGFFTYSNAVYASEADYYMIKGSRDGTATIDSLRKPQPHQLEIFLAGHYDGTHWPGWFFNALDPYAAPDDGITILPNAGITDAGGNRMDNVESTYVIGLTDTTITLPAGGTQTVDFTPAAGINTNFWDVSPPGISAYRAFVSPHPIFPNRLNAPTTHELVIRDNDGNTFMDTVDFFIQDNLFSHPWNFFPGEDNTQTPGIWDPPNDIPTAPSHPDVRQVPNTSGTNVSIPRGLRDSSLTYPGGNALAAFYIGEVDETIMAATRVTDMAGTFNTGIENTLFAPSAPNSINAPDDQYFSLIFDDSIKHWDTLVELYTLYDATLGFATDLAGNLMPSSGYEPETIFTTPHLHPARFSQNPYADDMGEGGKLSIIERSPPEIILTLAAVGGTRIYVKFSEPVFGADDLSDAIAATDFTFNGGNSISSIEIISSNQNFSSIPGITELYLNLSAPLTAEMLLDATIVETNADSIWDKAQNSFPDASIIQRRITDVALGVIQPVWATDGIQADDIRGSGFSALRQFDGTGTLDDLDITIESSLLSMSAGHVSLPIDLYFDINVPNDKRINDTFWGIFEVAGLITQPNNAARRARLLSDLGHITQHIIPAGDDEIQHGVTLEFLYSVGDRIAAWVEDPNDPLSLKPWSFKIGGVVTQRGGATILNNVINPEAGDQTILNYELKRAGIVIINVFTLDGDLVKVLQRGRSGAGVYNLSWDGTNTAGDNVARGFYFIRITGPGIDQVRKVLVVK